MVSYGVRNIFVRYPLMSLISPRPIIQMPITHRRRQDTPTKKFDPVNGGRPAHFIKEKIKSLKLMVFLWH